MRICVFGDSIAWGLRDPEQGGWVDRLKQYMLEQCYPERKIYKEVYNFAISGDQSIDILERIEPCCNSIFYDIKQYKKTNIVIFAIGINDTVQVKGVNRIPLNQFEENMLALINISKKFADKILVIGITPVDESRTNPIPWNLQVCHNNKEIIKYNQSLKSICNKHKIEFLDIYNFGKKDYTRLWSDGLHLNSEGHKKIYMQVRKFLEEKKWI